MISAIGPIALRDGGYEQMGGFLGMLVLVVGVDAKPPGCETPEGGTAAWD